MDVTCTPVVGSFEACLGTFEPVAAAHGDIVVCPVCGQSVRAVEVRAVPVGCVAIDVHPPVPGYTLDEWRQATEIDKSTGLLLSEPPEVTIEPAVRRPRRWWGWWR